ncbi:MAG: Slp family lipoprotein [Nitrospirales bacterium]
MRMGRDRVSNAVRSSATAIGVACLLSACSATLPSQYIHRAEPGVTLTMLASNPDRYRDKVVILGGVIVEEKQMDDHLFLRLRNRPLDKDYMPHRPPFLESPEAGHYWVMMRRQDLPADYRQWARVTVVGQVAGLRPGSAEPKSESEPVLAALYLRGWGDAVMNNGVSTATFDRNYSMSVPKGARGEFGLQ